MSSEKKRKRESTSTSDGQVKQQPHKEVKMKIAVDTGFTPIIGILL